jgi:hypothetical protein
MAPKGLVWGSTNLSCRFNIGSNPIFQELLCEKQSIVNSDWQKIRLRGNIMDFLVRANTYQFASLIANANLGTTTCSGTYDAEGGGETSCSSLGCPSGYQCYCEPGTQNHIECYSSSGSVKTIDG